MFLDINPLSVYTLFANIFPISVANLFFVNSIKSHLFLLLFPLP